MPATYNFTGKDKEGRIVKGTMVANSEKDVADRLREQGYFVVALTEKKESKEIKMTMFKSRRIKPYDLAILCRQMATMSEAGLPLVKTLSILKEQTAHLRLKGVIGDVLQKVEMGKSFYEAVASHPKVFPKIFCHMIRAGEAGGVLEEVLHRLAEHFEKELALTQKVKSAMMYPIVIICVAIGVVFFLMVSVIPTFVSLFEGLGSELPGITQFVINLSDWLIAYWWLLFGTVALLVVFFSIFRNTPKGKLFLDKVTLKVPLIGNLVRKTMVARFSRTLGTLSTSGVAIIEALAIVEEIIENKVLANILIHARIKLQEGINLSIPLEKSGEFPRMLIEMIRIGEETGSIDTMLNKVADFYDQEVDHSVAGLVSMIEPLMVVFIAGIVGFIVISVMMPMFEMLTTM